MWCTLPYKKERKKEQLCATTATLYIDCTWHPGQGTIELAAASSHAGSHGEFQRARRHDKRRI